ncbi:MAG: glycine--tRNA ligase [Candidatus Uhrbacteria bacterium]
MAVKDMETIVSLAKSRGFIYPGSEIYGGLANSWDYGPLGVELKNNIKQAWWEMFVHQRFDMVGIDAALIMNPKTYEASGHLEHFTDPLVECKECHARHRADHLIDPNKCPACGNSGTMTDPAMFNMMLKTFLGPKEEGAATVYLRPETAQAIFVDFPSILQTSRKRIPFGVAQIGKAFRNEITPGNFIFRTREFEQMEIEYFVHENDWEKHFENWLSEMKRWVAFLGLPDEEVVYHEIEADDLAHYSKRTVDIEYKFPFGQDELYGLAYRTNYDLSQHQKVSGKDMQYTDPDSGEKYLPHVIEPSLGVDRSVLAVLCSAYTEEIVGEEKRVVMKLPKELAPFKIAVLPLSKKPELMEVAKPIWEKLAQKWNVDYDLTQSIGRRYRRQDEIGTPYCVTVDFDSLEDKQVTVRDRDTMKQDRIAIDELESYFQNKL